MSNLSLIPPPTLPAVQLPQHLKKNPFVLALQAKKVMDCSDLQIMETLIPAIENAIFDLALKMGDADVGLLQDKVLFEVKSLFKTLTLEEIKTAIYNGARGQYETEPQYGLSVIRVTRWLAGYLSAYERKEAKEQLQKLAEKPAEPTEAEKKALSLQVLVNAWESFKKDGFFDDFGNAVYGILDSLGLIVFTDERKRGFMDVAKFKLKNYYDPIKQVGNVGKQNDYRAVLKGIEAGTEKERIIAEAKRIAINVFFKEMVEIGTELTELLDLENA